MKINTPIEYDTKRKRGSKFEKMNPIIFKFQNNQLDRKIN